MSNLGSKNGNKRPKSVNFIIPWEGRHPCRRDWVFATPEGMPALLGSPPRFSGAEVNLGARELAPRYLTPLVAVTVAVAMAIAISVSVPVVVAVAITMAIAVSVAHLNRMRLFNFSAWLSKQNNCRLNLADFAITDKQLNLSEESELPVPDGPDHPNYLISRKYWAFKGGPHFDQARAAAKSGVPCPNSQRLASSFNQQTAGEYRIRREVHWKNPMPADLHFTGDSVFGDFAYAIDLKHLFSGQKEGFQGRPVIDRVTK